ncbi:phosphodiester glycosidase family protein [Deinococcus sp.]|uniref:phosphodiester glycosidase family protein n=1 Tax=Deinococcus sp. TaxID=47478 RepID=UPI0025BF2CFB|nr:phosphodiester glycosidase family protein [Deinococcus sp.]
MALPENAGLKAASNFMYFNSPTSPTVNEGLIGQLIINASTVCAYSAKNIDAITYDTNGSFYFHTQTDALAMKGSVQWSIGSGPHIVKDGSVTKATWATRSGLRENDPVERIAMGVTSTGYMVLAYRNALTLTEMANYMISLGCKNALAGDSGGSARLYRKDVGKFEGTDLRPVQVFTCAANYTLISDLP